MKVVLVKPMEKAEIVDIAPTLKNYQKIVGGFIETVYPFDDPVVVVCNDEGKFYEEPNRALYGDDGKDYDIIFGTFFVCGLGEEDFQSLTDDLSEKYRKKFERGEMFIKTNGGIAVMRF